MGSDPASMSLDDFLEDVCAFLELDEDAVDTFTTRVRAFFVDNLILNTKTLLTTADEALLRQSKMLPLWRFVRDLQARAGLDEVAEPSKPRGANAPVTTQDIKLVKMYEDEWAALGNAEGTVTISDDCKTFLCKLCRKTVLLHRSDSMKRHCAGPRHQGKMDPDEKEEKKKKSSQKEKRPRKEDNVAEKHKDSPVSKMDKGKRASSKKLERDQEKSKEKFPQKEKQLSRHEKRPRKEDNVAEEHEDRNSGDHAPVPKKDKGKRVSSEKLPTQKRDQEPSKEKSPQKEKQLSRQEKRLRKEDKVLEEHEDVANKDKAALSKKVPPENQDQESSEEKKSNREREKGPNTDFLGVSTEPLPELPDSLPTEFTGRELQPDATLAYWCKWGSRAAAVKVPLHALVTRYGVAIRQPIVAYDTRSKVEYSVEKVLKKRKKDSRYLVRWEGYPELFDTWENRTALGADADAFIEAIK